MGGIKNIRFTSRLEEYKFYKHPMTNQTYFEIVTPELLSGAIENNEFDGFKEDYAVLHCLIRKYQPSTFFEVGSSIGTGTNIICNAGKNWMIQVYSLDLPSDKADNGERTGTACKFGYTQLRGDSMKFDFAPFCCDGWFIDGAHTTKHVEHETLEALSSDPKLIVWHDSDIPEVMQGIQNAFDFVKPEMELIRVTGTRVTYAIKK